MGMNAYVISNPVPSPEEMGRLLGLSPERVARVRSIMNAPSSRKTSKRSGSKYSAVAAKKATSRAKLRASGKR